MKIATGPIFSHDEYTVLSPTHLTIGSENQGWVHAMGLKIETESCPIQAENL